jgi:hypothetical protein
VYSMNRRPLGWPPSIVALVAIISAGCAVDDKDAIGGDVGEEVMPPSSDGDSTTDEPTTDNDNEDGGDDSVPPPPVVCNDPSAYTPYTTAVHPTGKVSAMPWHGAATTYPASLEDFRGYSPSMVECSNNKSTRSHLDVTAGCLNAVADTHGQIVSTSAGAFRAVVLGYTDADAAHAIRWTDQSIEYGFFYTATSGDGVLPGFKAFARYNTEEDLYVASWRMDGVVQIQRKQCGVYTPLKILKTFGAPTPGTWHRMKFSAIGNTLELYLDGVKVITVTDSAFASGTMGIRTDALTGALIDDWRVN